MNALVSQNSVVNFTKEQIALIKTTIAKEATDNELALFINQCQRTGMDPFTRQIYFIKDKNGKVTICTSIDGLRLVAERSGKYEGQTEPEWCGDDGVWKTVWLNAKEMPAAARVGVWKTGFKAPVYGVAVFREYAGMYPNGKLTYMWDKMGTHMIAKTAEALALRKAFPNDLSGLYATEEVSQAVEAFEARESNTTPAASEQLKEAKSPYVVTWGENDGKKFEDVSPKFLADELTKFKEVPKKTKRLETIIANIEQFLNEKQTREAQNREAELDARLGLT